MRAHERLEVGAVLINQVPTFRVENMPYGGIKDSGFGREGIRYAMKEMPEPRALIIRKTSEREQKGAVAMRPLFFPRPFLSES